MLSEQTAPPSLRRDDLRPLLTGAGVVHRLSRVTGWLGRYIWAGWAGLAGLFCIAAIWQLGHELYGSFILPSPLETLATAWKLVSAPQFPTIAATTAERALTGFVLAAAVGTMAGVVAGYSFAAMRLLKPIVTVTLGVPPIAWIVLALIWFGSGNGSAVMTVVLASMPVSFAGALEGVATRDRQLDAMARAFGASPLRRFGTVTLPHLLSYLFPAWTTTIGSAWKVTVMAELLSNTGGVGGELARRHRVDPHHGRLRADLGLRHPAPAARGGGALAERRPAVGRQAMKLALHAVGHSYLGRAVFEDFDLTLNPGEVVALLGPSGCGKTTILQIAAGLIDPLRGRVARAYRRHAVVFQEPRLLPWETTLANIGYGLAASGVARAERDQRAAARARDVGLLPEDMGKYPIELSGGMRQRAAVARALAVEPDVLFFDEPFTAVDVGLKRSLQDLVIAAAEAQSFSAIFVTHDLAEAVRVADRLVLLSGEDGRVLDRRAVAGRRGARSNRDIFEMVESWSHEPIFAELFDPRRQD